MTQNPGDEPITQEELAEALREELRKIPHEKDGWAITSVRLNGQPVELPAEWQEDPPEPEFDPGPECDDQGGMSELPAEWQEDPPEPEFDPGPECDDQGGMSEQPAWIYPPGNAPDGY